MITRKSGYLQVKQHDQAPPESLILEQSGACKLERVFPQEEVQVLREEITETYQNAVPDGRNPHRPSAIDEHFRYEMLNRSKPVSKPTRDFTQEKNPYRTP